MLGKHSQIGYAARKGSNMDIKPSVQRFTAKDLSAEAQSELDKQILQNVERIEHKDSNAVQRTLRRFKNWLTPGTQESLGLQSDDGEQKRKRSYEERVVDIDQGLKLLRSIANAEAITSDAIGAIWRTGYHCNHGEQFDDPQTRKAAKEHADRDGKAYTIRGNWALAKGLTKVGVNGYLDEVPPSPENLMCDCSTQYLYTLRSMPKELLDKWQPTANSKPKR